MTEPRLFERDRELASLTALVDDAVDGRGRCALIEGPAGIGKSRLLAETRSGAEHMRVLAARGGELEREFPFGVVRQLFEGLVSQPGDADRLLGGAAASARSVFGSLDDADGESGDASFATLHGLFWLTLNLAEEKPLLLAIDDLHWCDRASLRFVAYLVRRLEDVPVLVATTLRTAEPGTDMQLIGEIAQDPATVAVHPGSLSESAVTELVRERLSADADSRFCAACFAATGGNPLLLRQLLTALEADGVAPTAANAGVIADIGPRAVSRTVLPRLARLAPEAVAAARAVAVLGDGASQTSVAMLAGIEESAVAEAAAALARAEILLPELPLRFVHPLVREAVYRDLPAGERELQHARAARVISDAGASDDEIAAQLLLAPPRGDAWVARVLHVGGRAALRRGASESAAAYMRRALAEPPPDEECPRLLFELGAAEALNDGVAAREHLRQAYRALDDPVAKAMVAGLLGRALMFTGDPEAGAEVARRAIADLPEGMDDARLALEAFELMTRFFGAGDPGQITTLHSHRALPPPDAGVGAKMVAAMAAWEWMCTGGSAQETSELALAALRDGELISADGGLISMAAILTLVLAEREEAMEQWEAGLAMAHRRGSLYVISSMHLWRGQTYYLRGDLPEAEENLRSAYEEFGLWGFAESAFNHTSVFLANVARERGDVESAHAILDKLGPVEEGANWTGWWYASLCEQALAEGNAEEALRNADLLREHLAVLADPAYLWWRSLKAAALDRLDRRDEAERLLLEELEITRAYGAPSSLGRTLRTLGTVRRESGIDDLREAVEVLEGSPARLEQARALAALGGALRRARQPTEAREPLRRALELASVCDARRLVEDVRTELHATGVRPRTDAVGGVEALTPSERRVVDLAATGETNREIAQMLYVTPKTVEVHLSNSYRKLGIRSRRELPAALSAAA